MRNEKYKMRNEKWGMRNEEGRSSKKLGFCAENRQAVSIFAG